MSLTRVLLIHHSLLNSLRRTLDLVLHTLSRSSSLVRHLVRLNRILVTRSRGIDLVAAVVADEVCQILNRAGARVVDRLVLGTRLEELDGRETLDLIRDVVGGSVNLGDDDLVGVRLVHLGQLVVLGRQGLAVAAPGCVELEEHVLVVVDHDVLVILGHDNGDWALLLLRDRLALDARLELAGDVVVDEGADVLGADVLGAALLGVGELLVLLRVLDGESGPGAGLEVEVGGVLAEGGGVDGGEVDLAAVLLGDGLEGLGKGFALFGGLGEDVGERDAGLELKLASIMRKM